MEFSIGYTIMYHSNILSKKGAVKVTGVKPVFKKTIIEDSSLPHRGLGKAMVIGSISILVFVRTIKCSVRAGETANVGGSWCAR